MMLGSKAHNLNTIAVTDENGKVLSVLRFNKSAQLLTYCTKDTTAANCKVYLNPEYNGTFDEFGKHTISNIYYDTPDDLLIRRSIEKPAYKEKLRLRSYGNPTLDDMVFLEIKKKYDGIVNKRRIQLPLHAAYNYLNLRIKPFPQTQILSELDYFLSLYDLSPKLFLAYERIALFGKEDPEFRVTFDLNIRSRTNDLRLEHGSRGTLLFNDNTHLMEETKMWLSH